jgi:glycosyltransferase involved in cell wall biosynthesis
LALKAASLSKQKIIFCGRKSTENVNFFDQELSPFIDNINVIYIDNTERDEALELFKRSKAFLFPVQWEEPFGLVMIESMACGTPVIAFARGSVPEIIKDGETGLIVNPSDGDIRGNWLVKKTGIEGLCEAIDKIYSLPVGQYQQMRRNCRSLVEKNFTVEKMVNEYEKVYQQILAQSTS